MGSLVASNQISISVEAPSVSLFDFHSPPPLSVKTPLASPSFIARAPNNAIHYAQRCRFADREFEIDFKEESSPPEIILRRQAGATGTLWRVLSPGQTLPLQEGSVVRLADREFVIRRICQTFSDSDLQENLKTLSDIDLTEDINLANSFLRVHQSPAIKRSRVEKSMLKVGSVESLGEEGEFCRVCFGREQGVRNPLLSLCKCAGSVRNIHYLCLKRWIASKSRHVSSGAYEYYEYDLSCDLCRTRIDRVVHHRGTRYPVYSESLMHPPYVVMAYRNDSNQVREFIINFDHHSSVLLGRNKGCDLPLAERLISAQHCELVYQKNALFLRNLDPAFGTFVQLEDATISSSENCIALMINNHIVKLHNDSSHCFGNDQIRLRLEQPTAQ